MRPQCCHHRQSLVGHPAILSVRGVDAEELVIAGQRADSDAQLVAALRHVVEVRDPVG